MFKPRSKTFGVSRERYQILYNCKSCLYIYLFFSSVSDCAAFLNADMKKITQLIENYDVRYADQEDNVGIRVMQYILYPAT